MTGTSLHAPLMPWMTETEERRPHPIVRRRARQESLEEHTGDSAQTKNIGLASFDESCRSGMERPVQITCYGEDNKIVLDSGANVSKGKSTSEKKNKWRRRRYEQGQGEDKEFSRRGARDVILIE